jgi:flagellin-specific chaperone FliS
MNPYQLGLDQEILHAEPMDLVVLMFEKTFANLNLCLQSNAVLEDRIRNTEAILRELLQSLDVGALHLQGQSELARMLVDLYGFCLSQLAESMAHRELENLRVCRQTLVPIREAWLQVSQQHRAEISLAPRRAELSAEETEDCAVWA